MHLGGVCLSSIKSFSRVTFLGIQCQGILFSGILEEYIWLIFEIFENLILEIIKNNGNIYLIYIIFLRECLAHEVDTICIFCLYLIRI